MELNDIDSRMSLKKYWIETHLDDVKRDESERKALLHIAQNLAAEDWEKFLQAIEPAQNSTRIPLSNLTNFAVWAESRLDCVDSYLYALVLFYIANTQSSMDDKNQAIETYKKLNNALLNTTDTATAIIVAYSIELLSYLYDTKATTQDLLQVLNNLHTLLHKHPEPQIRSSLAGALFSVGWIFGEQQDSQNAIKLLAELRMLYNSHPETVIIERFANALSNTCWQFGKAGNLQAAPQLLSELRELTKNHDTPNIREQLAIALSNVAWLAGDYGNIQVEKNIIDELRSLATNHDEMPLRCQLSRSLASAVWHMREKIDIQEIKSYIDEIFKLTQEYSDPFLREKYAEALGNIAWQLGHSGDLAGERQYLDKMRNLSQESNETKIWEHFTTTLSYAIGHSLEAKEQQIAQKFYAELRSIAEEKDEESIWIDFSKSLSYLTLYSCNSNDISTATQFINEIQQIASRHPSSSVTAELGKSLFNLSISLKRCNKLQEAYDTCHNADILLEKEHGKDVNQLKESISIYKNRLGIELGIPSHERDVEQNDNVKEAETDFTARTHMIQALDEVIASFREVKARFLAQMKLREQRVTHFLSSSSRFTDDSSILMVLRQWNSYTPIIVDGQETDRGGGYFIRYKQIGLVIDPGYNFIELFHKAGCKIVDITHVAITHAHDDHTAQLEQLLTMFHQYNSRNPTAAKKVTLLLNHSTLKKFSGFNLHNKCPYIDKVICLNSFDPLNIQKIEISSCDEFSITVLKAYHDDVFTTDYAIGLGLVIGKDTRKRRIVFTGDTGFYPPMIHQGKQVVGHYTNSNGQKTAERLVDEKEGMGITCSYPKLFTFLPKGPANAEDSQPPLDTGIDLLIPHLGSIKEYEFDPVEPATVTSQIGEKDPETGSLGPMFYPNHLGILGTAMIIKELQPKAVILSEFGSELRGLRMEIAKLLRESLEKTMAGKQVPFIIPGDPSIVYNITDGQFLCHEDGKWYDPADINAMQVAGERVGIFKRHGGFAALDHFDNYLNYLINDGKKDTNEFSLPYMKAKND